MVLFITFMYLNQLVVYLRNTKMLWKHKLSKKTEYKNSYRKTIENCFRKYK